VLGREPFLIGSAEAQSKRAIAAKTKLLGFLIHRFPVLSEMLGFSAEILVSPTAASRLVL
jgi:hypothetical protein